jgi:hypothetical protein
LIQFFFISGRFIWNGLCKLAATPISFVISFSNPLFTAHKTTTIMRNVFISFSLLIIIGAFIQSSCKSDTGPVGPQGIQGPQGPQGFQGQAGQNAQIIYSGWIRIGSASPGYVNYPWEAGDTIIGLQNRVTRANIPAPSLTQSILNHGLILVYGLNSGTASPSPANASSVQLLPLQFSGSPFGFPGTFSWGYIGAVNRIVFTVANLSTGISTVTIDGFVRYVLVPGLTAGRFTSGPLTGYSAEQVKSMSYDQVMALYHIPASGTNEK